MQFKILEKISGFENLTQFQKIMFQIMHSNVDTGGCLLITSDPGLGKTQIIKDMTKKLNSKLIDIRLSQKDETEVGLFPVVVNDESGFPEYVKEIPPHWAHLANNSSEEYIIVVFEELNRARREIQNGALQILMERAIGHDFSFNNNVLFVATSNIDDAYTEELSDAMKGRLVHIPFDFIYSDWKKNWANENINEVLLKWLDSNPEYLKEKPKDDDIAYCSPRSIERLSKCLDYVDDDIQSMIQYVRYVGKSIIGDTSNLLLEFLKKYSKVKAIDILNNYTKVEPEFEKLERSDVVSIVNDLSTIFSGQDSYSTDQHKNVISFLKYEIDGIQLVEDDVVVSFLKEFIDHIKIEDISNLRNIDERYKIYLKEFQYELNLLYQKPTNDELVHIFNRVTKLNIQNKNIK